MDPVAAVLGRSVWARCPDESWDDLRRWAERVVVPVRPDTVARMAEAAGTGTVVRWDGAWPGQWRAGGGS